jgi:hypothetical protein
MITLTRRTIWLLTVCLGASAAVLLVIDHWAHLFGALPYLLLLACPLMHLLHGGHGSHSAPPSPGDGGRRT